NLYPAKRIIVNNRDSPVHAAIIVIEKIRGSEHRVLCLLSAGDREQGMCRAILPQSHSGLAGLLLLHLVHNLSLNHASLCLLLSALAEKLVVGFQRLVVHVAVDNSM